MGGDFRVDETLKDQENWWGATNHTIMIDDLHIRRTGTLDERM